MRVSELSFFPFRVPFLRPYATAAGVAQAREGVICRLETEEGSYGLGEGSLLPYLPADEDRLGLVIKQAGEALRGRSLEPPFGDDLDWLPAPLKSAIEIAAWDAAGRAGCQPLASLLNADAASAVELNALLTGSALAEMLQTAEEGVEKGFRAFKLKVGAISLEEDVARVQALRRAVGDGPLLRLDANGAWDEDAAAAFLEAVSGFGIDYLEQPLPPGNLEATARLRRVSPVALGLDEELAGIGKVSEILEAEAADVLILKPLALGGISPCLEIAGVAKEAQVRVTATTTIDAGVGTAAALHLASALASEDPAGLATLDLLADDLILEGLPVSGGRMALPESFGLGVDLDRAALATYSKTEEAAAG